MSVDEAYTTTRTPNTSRDDKDATIPSSPDSEKTVELKTHKNALVKTTWLHSYKIRRQQKQITELQKNIKEWRERQDLL